MSSDWIDIDKFHPECDLPCEYIIEVKCRGWFRPNGEEPRFAGDERVAPGSRFSKWKKWDEGEKWEEGQRLVMEHREKIAKDGDENEQDLGN